MPVRVNPVDEAERRARHQLAALTRDLRAARLAAGLSQASVAGVIGRSRARLAEWELGRARPDLLSLARWSAAVGLDVPFRGYPGPSPLRDAAQLRILARARDRIGNGWTWRTEMPVSTDPLDRRAVDAVVIGAGGRIGLEIISRLTDAQAQVRAAVLKQGSATLDRMLLVLADSRHNRRALLEGTATIRPAFPLGSRALLTDLRAGRLPASNGVLLV